MSRLWFLINFQPIFSPRGISPLFLVFGVLLIPLGVLIFTMSKNIQELKFDYTDCLNSNGDKCSDIVQKMTGESCSCIINFQLEEPMKVIFKVNMLGTTVLITS